MTTKNREIRINRTFNAPRELVFDAWTEPDKIGRWWGPNGFTTTTQNMDFCVGGNWVYIMHGPDGTDYPNRIVYTEIKKPKLIKYDHSGQRPDDEVRFKVTVNFEKNGKKTIIDFRMVFPTVEARDNAAEFGAVEGAHQTLGRLADFVE